MVSSCYYKKDNSCKLCNHCFLAVQCVWDDWNIGACSKSCGTGTRTNNRTKLIVESGGGNCTGQHTETEVCGVTECPGNINRKPLHQDNIVIISQ